jgi:hypothetical protein
VSQPTVILAIARADFLERVRRYSFLFILGFALYLGYLAIRGNLALQVGHQRGISNSAWIGALLALVVGCFITLIGFYFVKNTIERDRQTRVGQILAAAPMSRFTYTLGKTLSNLAVLSAAMAVVLLSGIAMQLISGEDRHIVVWNLIAPFLFLALPALFVIAAIAVFFETVPFLRGGFGNVTYFFLWTALLSTPVATQKHTLDLVGITIIADSAKLAAQLSPQNNSVGFSLRFGEFQRPLQTFVWNGVDWTSEILLSRLIWIGLAFALIALAALLFDRFDPSRSAGLRARVRTRIASQQFAANSPSGAEPLTIPASAAISAAALTPLARNRHNSRFFAVVSAELRLMLKGQKWWWYSVAAGLLLASAAIPSPDGRGIALAFAWIWPVLLWSSMGVREMREQTYQLIFSAPHPLARQLPAIWCAGVLVALLTGSGFGLRALSTGNLRVALAWLVGALFIPTFALAFGVWSGSGKPFEILYTLWWYLGPLHAFSPLDFMGAAPITATTRYPLMYFAVAAALGAAALAGRKRQLLS